MGEGLGDGEGLDDGEELDDGEGLMVAEAEEENGSEGDADDVSDGEGTKDDIAVGDDDCIIDCSCFVGVGLGVCSCRSLPEGEEGNFEEFSFDLDEVDGDGEWLIDVLGDGDTETLIDGDTGTLAKGDTKALEDGPGDREGMIVGEEEANGRLELLGGASVAPKRLANATSGGRGDSDPEIC